MGYKLAGFDVIGANDVDPKMQKIYLQNHHPRLYYFQDIRILTEQKLPDELYNLDILDGSPPCTTFSTAGSREDSWGQKRKYKEGDFSQTLDDLYFAFIRLVKKLQPKIVVSENVSGLAKGAAIVYLKNIIKAFNEAGYDTQIFMLNAATMGVPQKRQRLFVIGKRKDLNLPKLTLTFNEKPIRYGEFRSKEGIEPTKTVQSLLSQYTPQDKDLADIRLRVDGKNIGFTSIIVKDSAIYPTVIATGHNYRAADKLQCSDSDYILASSFPIDYDFMGLDVKYVTGMSVPPLMIAKIAEQIKLQWLDMLQ